MTKKEWQIHFGLLDEEMHYLEAILKVFDGKIVTIRDNPNRELLRV